MSGLLLRDGSTTRDQRLDLIRNPERRDFTNHHIRELVEEQPAEEGDDVGRIWAPSPHVLDQGREGACVGYAIAADLGGAPMRRYKRRPTELQMEALTVYHRAQELDPWPETGPGGSEEGTSVEAGMRAAVEQGHFDEFRVGESLDDLALAMQRGRGHGEAVFGPAVIGVEWRDGMYEATDGVVDISGAVVGGHAIWVRGWRYMHLNGTLHRVFVWRNSWGLEYGLNGDAEILDDNLAAILGPEPEVFFPVGRHWPDRVAT